MHIHAENCYILYIYHADKQLHCDGPIDLLQQVKYFETGEQ
jgi:hypothetical protein